jgi:hypothetical protein
MTQLTISLSRAHKIAERIKTRMNELAAEATALMGNQSVSGVGGEAQITKLQGMATKGMAALDQALVYSEAFAKLRSAIGAQNQSRGINEMLAELESLNRTMGTLKTVLSSTSAKAIAPSELAEYKPLNTSNMHASIAVAVLAPEQVNYLTDRHAKAQREAFALSDRIAEANAKSFTVDLPDDIAAVVTGG